MRLIHLSDLHLGYRQYHRTTPAGINQREADVASVFRSVIDKVIALSPDIVLFAGDIFHSVRPPNPAILHAFQQFARLTAALPNAIVVMVAGNHDTPRSAETGCILRLFAPLGIHVVDAEPKRLNFPERSLSILAVPDLVGLDVSYSVDDAATYNVLLAHCEVVGAVPTTYGYEEQAAVQVLPEDLQFAKWSYAALGHHHVFRQLAPNAYYTGSLEYTSVNVWGELAEEDAAKLPGKRFMEYDLETKKRTVHTVPLARPLLNLPPIGATGLTASEVDAAIKVNVDKVRGGIDGKIVRQIVRDIPRHIARELDHKAQRDYRKRALHFHLDTRRPEIVRSLRFTSGPGRRPSLLETVRDLLWSRALSPDVDRQELVDLGLRYLREAETRESFGGPGAAVDVEAGGAV